MRDRAILKLFYSSALRRSKLTGLEISDLNLTNHTLWIRQGKGRKDRVVPVGSRAILWIQRYLREVRPQLVRSQEKPGLFLTSYGTRFSPDVLTRRVRTLIRTAGIRHPGACHILRHTCATQMLEAGADIRLIQQLLGHADLRTTSVYTEVTIRHLRKVHQQTHPAERAAPKL